MAEDYRQETVALADCEVPVQIGGEGPPLLLLHGAGGAGMWLDFHRALARHFTVHAPVHPGFAGTPLPDWVQGADDLAFHYVDVMGALGLTRAVIVGISLGGWIATELAVFRSDLIERLVLVGAVGVRSGHLPPDLFIMEPGEAIPYLFADPAHAAALAPSEISVEVIVRMWSDQAAVARLMWKRPYNPRLRRRLHHIAAPTLVCWGAQDRLLPLAHGEMLAREIPGAQLVVLEGAGHVVPIEKAQELARHIVDFAAPATAPA